MAAVHWAGVTENYTSLFIMLISWGMLIAILWLSQSILHSLRVNRFWILVALLLLVTDESMIMWTRSGLEAIFIALLVMTAVWALSGSARCGVFGVDCTAAASSD